MQQEHWWWCNTMEEEELDYNIIEKTIEEIINSPYDPENYFKREGTE